MELPDLRRYARAKTVTNRWYLIAEEIAQLTKTPPLRWIREVKQHEWAVTRALVDLKEAKAKNPAALYTWLIKKYKKQATSATKPR